MKETWNSAHYWRYQMLGLLAALLVISGGAEKVVTWWEASIIYQVYPRSFKDSNGDGVGDIPGIISKLDHFTYLGVKAVWLSPVYKSPMVDFGYDISDFKDIDPIFGNLEDFDELVQTAHQRGIHVIMDFVPGHASTEHVWFQKSVSREENYTNYFIWNDGNLLDNGTRVAPNNWLSVFGGPAWTWHPVRKQFYYHAFTPEQADLNYRDENVHREMKQVLRFWLDRGVDGFRVDAIEKLYEVEDIYLNEPISGQNVTSVQHEYLNHIYTSNQPEIIPTVTSWFHVLEEYKQQDGNDRYMVIELYAEPEVRNQLYTTGGNPFNFDLIDLTPNPTGYEIRDKILNEYDNLPSGKWPNFVLGNHDRRRVSHKFGPQYVDVYNMLLLTLWGTPTTYYGEEIGMCEGIILWEETVDPWGRNFGKEHYQEFSRDPERTPLPWTGGYQAGFTTGNKTWLPLGENYTIINVQTQMESETLTSIQLYKQLAALRQQPAFLTGSFQIAYVDTNILSYTRQAGGDKYLVVVNVGKQAETVNLSTYSTVQPTAIVIAVTPSIGRQRLQSSQLLDKVTVNPGDGLVLQIAT